MKRFCTCLLFCWFVLPGALSAGAPYAWGDNEYGQLGIGDLQGNLRQALITGIKQISAGCEHSLAVKTDGTVWVWGRNYYGQLGDGTYTSKSSPVQVPGLTGVASVSAGGYHSLAVVMMGLLSATFNYSASSPSSPLLPTVNNGSTFMSLDPWSNMGLYTTTDIRVAYMRLNTAVATADDIWTSVPFTIDLLIQDAATMAMGLFTITGAISGATRVGASTLSLDYINIVPQCQTIGSYNYCITLPQGWFGAPMASSIPGVDGSIGMLAVRVSASSRYQTVDIAKALRISAGLQTATGLEAALYNVDPNSAGVTTTDVSRIARKVAGLDVNP